jgi:hypothetical protein
MFCAQFWYFLGFLVIPGLALEAYIEFEDIDLDDDIVNYIY